MAVGCKDELIFKLEDTLAAVRADVKSLKEERRAMQAELFELRSLNEENQLKTEILIECKSKDEINLKRALYDKRKTEEQLA
ncbi:MAG: hypothetical protein V2I33_22185 [Kangiellaceae bacterium]|jgi:hypothetical protein|nr:hypothetical protein [Kangiellaceae bacterium]